MIQPVTVAPSSSTQGGGQAQAAPGGGGAPPPIQLQVPTPAASAHTDDGRQLIGLGVVDDGSDGGERGAALHLPQMESEQHHEIDMMRE
jgi:hypothetical protein